MNHSAAVCRQCSKTYTDIGDGKPYCAECLLTSEAPHEPAAMVALMDALGVLYDVAEARGDAGMMASVEAVSAWLCGAEKPSNDALWDVFELAAQQTSGEDAANNVTELGDTYPSGFVDACARLMLIGAGVEEP